MRHSYICALTLFIIAASCNRTAAQDKNLRLAHDGNRVALVIGNAKYPKSVLKNPVNDARAIKTLLENLGWEVIFKVDLDKRGMKDALDTFGKKLGKDSIALFYYSGHGAEFAGQNYLIPTVFDIRKEADVADEAVNATSALYEMEECRIKIVILDACRDNPFGLSFQRSGKRGLGPMPHPTETIVFYAASPGQTADDNSTEQNGLFTSALLKYIPQPGLPIEQVFKSVASEVQRKSGKRQVPELSGTLIQDFYFVPGATAPRGGKVVVVETQGELSVTSDPSGARIFINGKNTGRLTPFDFNYELDTATVDKTVRLEREGYRPVTLVATLERGKQTPIEHKLVKLLNHPVGDGSAGSVAARGRARINQIDRAEMAYVPGGEFTMGDSDRPDNPPHRVTLDGYYIYKNLVTVAQYREFCSASGHQMAPAPPWGWSEDNPIVNVYWADAVAYCNWAGVRLPMEAEWELAARGKEGRKFPWGNDFNDMNLWGSVTNKRDRTKPVGSYPEGMSPCGALDMAGNVWQWCADWYDPDYCKKPNLVNPTGPALGVQRVVRGGSWDYNEPSIFRTSRRFMYVPLYRDGIVGFRCVSQK